MTSQFSEDGKYFAQLSTDGKLKIWNTIANSFEQEFTPDYHLTSPCTCLHFLECRGGSSNKASPSPKKKKRKESDSNLNIALGTTNGLLIVYSVTKGDVNYTINSETNQSVVCLSTYDGNKVFSGADQSVIEWNVQKRTSTSWKAGNENVTAILAVPNSNQIVTASKTIKLWNTSTREVIRQFTGHSSDVMFLHYVKPELYSDAYLLSGSKGDRLLSCWSMSENSEDKNTVGNFLMEDIVQNVSVYSGSDGKINVATTVRSGVVHIYTHKLNGKRGKPLKPKTTIQVVSDTGQNDEMVTPIRIFGAIHRDEETLCIVHGTEIYLTFENLAVTTYKKVECLIRKDPRKFKVKNNEVIKTQTPEISNDVYYLTPQTSSVKRKVGGQLEVPMEQRLENLTLNKLDGASKVPASDNVAQLLIQGLHSKDKNMLKTVLSKRDENVIKNTVKRLPVKALVPFIKELTTLVNKKTVSSQTSAVWLRHIVQSHASILMSNPDLADLLNPAIGEIEQRLHWQVPLCKLTGRLEILVSQVSRCTSSENHDENEEPLLMFNDKESSDSDSEVMQVDLNTESENDDEWDEDGSEEAIENENDNEVSDSDSEVSS